MSRPLRVRDPVHGFIYYSETEAALIDTPALQRLRGIKQLAFTYLVYPGATHTRFEHSLGVMHVAGRIAEQVGIERDGPEWRRIRLAALLHDIGHLPFSHAGETATLALALPAIGERKEEAHESITAALIEGDRDIGSVLSSDEDRLAVLDLLRKAKETEPLLWQILSGPLDADKLDYLLRDSLMTGVKYGVFDLDRVIDSFVPHGPIGQRHLVVRKEDAPCVEQYLLARYYMTEQVYRHRVRRITDLMLRDAIVSAAKLDSESGKGILSLFKCETENDGWRQVFLETDDSDLLRGLAACPEDQVCGRFGRALSARRLPKQVFDCRIDDIRHEKWADGLIKNVEEQEKLRQRFAGGLGLPEESVLLDIRTKDNPLHRDPNVSVEDDILVLDTKKGEDQRLSDLPESLSASARVKEEAKLYVYAEAEGANLEEREEMGRKLEKMLETAAREAST